MGAPGFVEVDRWLEQGAAPLDPLTMHYRAKVADEGANRCAGCIFRRQSSGVCKVAAAEAVKRQFADCDHVDDETGRTFIYLRVTKDERQIDLFGTAP